MGSTYIKTEDLFDELIKGSRTKAVINKRRKWVRQLLNKYKDGTASEAEKEYIVNHIQGFMSCSKLEKEERCAQILCLFYLYPHPPTVKQLAEQYHISISTVFDNINSAIDELTVTVFGIDGVEENASPLPGTMTKEDIEKYTKHIADMAIDMYIQNKTSNTENVHL